MKKKVTVLVLLIGLHYVSACKEGPENRVSKGYFTCSMHPQVIQQEKGTCPICGMNLTYVEAKTDPAHKDHDKEHKNTAADNESRLKNYQFSLGSDILVNANLATVVAQKEPFERKARYSAHLDYNENPGRLVIVTTKYDGWLERVYVSKEGQYLKRGQAVFGVYSPKILAAKEEYVTTYNSLKDLYQAQGKPLASLKDDPTVKAARRKLKYLDVSEGQVKTLETSGKASRLTYYHSPISGVVIKKDILQGAFIRSGQELLRVANLSSLWAFIHIFEKDLAFIKKGQQVELKTTAYPDEKFSGRIDLIYPFLDPSTRDIKVRISIQNRKRLLKPGMFAEVVINSKLAGDQIVIPDTATIFSGEKRYAFVSLGQGRFELRPIKIKIASDGKAVISEGIAENDVVIVNGQFLLDSEASLKEALDKGTSTGHNH